MSSEFGPPGIGREKRNIAATIGMGSLLIRTTISNAASNPEGRLQRFFAGVAHAAQEDWERAIAMHEPRDTIEKSDTAHPHTTLYGVPKTYQADAPVSTFLDHIDGNNSAVLVAEHHVRAYLTHIAVSARGSGYATAILDRTIDEKLSLRQRAGLENAAQRRDLQLMRDEARRLLASLEE